MSSETVLAGELPMIVKWKNADFEPAEDAPVAYVSRNGKMGTFRTTAGKDWKWLRHKYSIAVWIYQDSLIPPALIEKWK